MKKTTLFLLGLLFVSVQAFADTRAQALLLHNGQGKSFNADQLQVAVNEAVTGDSICLSEGTFDASAGLTIDKVIVVMGAGENTRISGNVNIAIEGTPTGTAHMFDALRITGNVIVSKELHGLKIRKCWIGGYLYSTDILTDVQIDRCCVMGFSPVSYVKSAIFVNSILRYVGPQTIGQICNSTGNELVFQNCSISRVASPYAQGKLRDITFVNSVIVDYTNDSYVSNNTFINSLLGREPSAYYGNIAQNCFVNPELSSSSDTNGFPTFNLNGEDLTTELLMENNYLGNDGTVVGAYGGTTPYTLAAEGLSIKEHVLRVNPETRQLNVSLKVATE